ncbi:MAG: hypothetical protein KatS3mg131_2797 [Candidatus Tectimicrobiota bacterium]|nr:MAG: hypothetical protein KatS3mg131_2797 [Candidatus Tectomicrobia bacterium]
MLEANLDYWDTARRPRLRRIVFDNTQGQKDALEAVKTGEGEVDLVTGLSPLETLQVAQSPFATVVKNRGALVTVFGMFNMRKPGSPWTDVRLRQAVNYAINRADLIRYATKGNGVIIPALVPHQGFGYDPDLAPYPFAPAKARQLLQAAGVPQGMAITLVAPEDLEVQATVIGKMLEQVGFTVRREVLDASAYNRKTFLSHLAQPAEHQTWDIALASWLDLLNFPVFQVYHFFALDGPYDWVREQPALRQLRDQVLRTVDRERQAALIRQMERHTHEQAYFLFLYNPIQLYAVNKAVQFVPYLHVFSLAETAVSEQHWSLRKQKAAVPE